MFIHIIRAIGFRGSIASLLGLLSCVAAAQQPRPTNNPSAPIVAALRSHDYAEAKRLSESAVKQFPNDAKLWTLNGMASERLGDDAAALGSYDHALRLAPDYLPALEAAAQTTYGKGEQAAVRYLNRLVHLQPENGTAHAMLAALAFKRGDCADAVNEYQESPTVANSDPKALQQFGACLVKLGRAKEALAPFGHLLETLPGNATFRYNLAVDQLMAGKPQDVIATLASSSNDAEALDVLAEAYEQVGDTPKAVDALHRAIVQNPNEPRYYVDFANISLVHASYQVGIDMLDFGLNRLPQAASLYVARGILYVNTGQYEKSDADFETAERLDPRVEATASARGMSALEQNHLPEAEATVRKQLAHKPQDAFLQYLLAEILARQGAAPDTQRFHEALQAAQTAVRIQPDFEVARDVLGRLYLQEGDTAQAVQQSRLAVHENPDDVTALYHLIQALKKAQQTTELPALLKQLTQLRQQAQLEENRERHFVLQEQAH